MKMIFDFLNQGWVGAVIGLLGLIAAYITYKFSKIGSRLVYQWQSLKIISKNNKVPEELEIKYKGKSVPRLIKTQIVFWNAGTRTINGEDIVKADPLKMVFAEGEEIVSFNIIKVTREINRFSYSIANAEKNKLYFEFDFLDPNDGAVLEVLHTDNMRYPEITGTIKGMPDGILNWSNTKRHKNKLKEKVRNGLFFLLEKLVHSKKSFTILMILGVIFLLVSFCYLTGNSFFYEKLLFKKSLSHNEKILQGTNWFVLGILYFSMGGTLLKSKRRRYPKSLYIEAQDTLKF